MAAAAAIPQDIIQRLLPRPAAASRPTRLSDLEKISYLGEGGFGAVFKVRHRGTSAVYALKTALCADGTAHVEARALGLCAGSPHVVRLHAILPGSSGNFGLLLELMDAGSLHSALCRRGGRGFPEPAVAEVAAQCLAGLEHLHFRGVAHLDIKPGNLLASSLNDIKIGDFGLSKILSGPDDSVRITSGTPSYMSPERFEHGARAGRRGAFAADVWSLGVTLLELYFGWRNDLPAGATPTLAYLMREAGNTERPSLELLGFLTACLIRQPSRRPTVTQLMAHPFVACRDVERSRRSLWEVIVDSKEA